MVGARRGSCCSRSSRCVVTGLGNLVAVLVYGVCVTSMLAVSAVYHSGRLSPDAISHLKRVDHSTILLAIAGSYTAVITLGLTGTTQPALWS